MESHYILIRRGHLRCLFGSYSRARVANLALKCFEVLRDHTHPGLLVDTVVISVLSDKESPVISVNDLITDTQYTDNIVSALRKVGVPTKFLDARDDLHDF